MSQDPRGDPDRASLDTGVRATTSGPTSRSWWTFAASNYGRVGILVVTAPLIAQALGPAGRGLYALAMAADIISTQLLSFGLPQAAGFRARHHHDSGRKSVGYANRYMPLITTAAATVTVAVFLTLRSTFTGWSILAPCLLILLTPVTTYSNVIATVSAAHGTYRHIAAQVLLPVVIQACYIVAGAAGLFDVTVVGAIIALLVGRLAALALMSVQSPYAHLRTVRRDDAGVLRYGLRSMPGTFGQAAYGQVDQLVIAATMSEAYLGIYAVAVTVGSVVYPMAISLATRIFYDRPTTTTADQQVLLARMSTLFVILFAAAVAVVSPYVIDLAFGPEFAKARPVAPVLCIGVGFYGFYTASRALLDSAGRPGAGSIAQLVSVALMVPLVMAFSSSGGLVGAAWGSVSAGAIRAGIMTVFCLRAKIAPPIPTVGTVRRLAARSRTRVGKLLREGRE